MEYPETIGAQYLGSLGPHHTPIPATASGPPFDLHAPSEYTMSVVAFFGAEMIGVRTGSGTTLATTLDIDRGTGFKAVAGGGFDGVRVTPALLGLVKTVVEEGAANGLNAEPVEGCGRLAVYHCSASGFVLNFLNLAPGYPWTYDWASSLRTNTVKSETQSGSYCTMISGADPKRSPLENGMKQKHPKRRTNW